MKTELKGIDGKVAIHCTTQEEYTQVLDLIPMDAKKRESMNFGFGKYGNETCIADNQLYYGRIDFWKSEGYTIIPASEFIAMNTEPEVNMRHEVIKLTVQGVIYPKLIKLLKGKGEKIGFMSGKLRDISCHDKLRWDEVNGWCLLPVGNSELPTITDYTFLQKYGNTEPEHNSKIVGADMICPITKKHCDDECCTIGSECNMSGDGISNTEPEADKERELLEGFLNWSGKKIRDEEIDSFLSSLRKPAFELICQDGVVTDPEQIVWVINNGQLVRYNAGMALGKTCYIQKSAANNHRRHNTPAIKLSDMVYDAESESYCIGLNAAHNLVNERINGK